MHDSGNKENLETGVEITEAKGGGSDPRNKRALDLHALQLFPSLHTTSTDECLDLVDDQDVASEATTLVEVKGDSSEATLMIAAKKIVSNSKEKPNVIQSEGNIKPENIATTLIKKEIRQKSDKIKPTVLNIQSPKAQKVPKLLNKQRQSEGLERSTRNANLTTEGSNISLSQKHNRYNSGTTNEEISLPMIKPKAGAISQNIEDSFVQFGMDAIRAHLEGKSEGINKVGLSSQSSKKVVKRALRFQRNLPIQSSHLLPKHKEIHSEEHSFTYGQRQQQRVATVMGLRAHSRKQGPKRQEISGLNTTTTIGTAPPPRDEVLMLAKSVISSTLRKDEDLKAKKASVAKKGVFTLRQSVGVGVESGFASKKRRMSPISKAHSKMENSLSFQQDRSSSYLQTQQSPVLYPSQKKRGLIVSSSQLAPRRYSSHHATQKHKISAHSILNDDSSTSMCLQGERRSSTHIGAVTDESSNFGIHSDRQPVEPSIPKPSHIPKYRLKMLMKQEKRKQRAIQPNHEALDLVMSASRGNKAKIFKTRTQRIGDNSQSRERISRLPAHSFSSYSQNRATPKIQNKKKSSPGGNKYAVYGAINSTLSGSRWELKREKSKAKERTIIGGGGGAGPRAGAITIIQTPLLNNINHYNSYNIGHLSFGGAEQ